MADIGGAVQSILAALGLGGSTPPPSPAGQSAPSAPPQVGPAGAAPSPSTNPMAMIQPPSELERVLGNPMLQGAADAYLGAIASPKSEGWGARLAHGGLYGLQGFNQAEQERLRLPLLAAQIQQSQAKLPLMAAQTQSNLARAQLQGAQAAQYAPNPQMAQHFMALSQDPSASPTQRQIYGMLADGVGDGTIKVEDAAKAAANEDVAGARSLLAQAQTRLANANTSLVPLKGQALQSEVGKNQAEAGLAGAKTGEVPLEEQHIGAETGAANAATALSQGKAAEIPGEEAKTAAETSAYQAQVPQQKLQLERQAQLQKQAEAAWAARPAYQKAEGAVGAGTDHETFIRNYVALHSVPPGTPHVSASGKPIVMGPDGQYHYASP